MCRLIAHAWVLLLALPLGSAANETTIPEKQRIASQVISTWSAPADRPMLMPTDVAVDPDGRVFVADGTNDRIVRFDSNGEYDGNLAEWNDPELKLNRPVGIAVDQRGALWIADTGNHRLVVVSTEGRPIEAVPLPSSNEGEPADPTDVAVFDKMNRVAVADNDHHTLMIRDGDDAAWKTLGKRGQSIGQFQWPFMLSFQADGDLFITEAIGARVQRLTAGQRWARQIGRWGVEMGQLYRPKGIAVGPAGRVYVSDSTLGVVQVFQPSGIVIGVLTDEQGRPLRFAHPMGISFGPDRRLYVVELRTNRVAVVSLNEIEKASTRDLQQGE